MGSYSQEERVYVSWHYAGCICLYDAFFSLVYNAHQALLADVSADIDSRVAAARGGAVDRLRLMNNIMITALNCLPIIVKYWTFFFPPLSFFHFFIVAQVACLL